MSLHLQFLITVLHARLVHARRTERGASVVEWVVITALLVGIATIVGAILLETIRGKADSIDLD